MKNIRAIRILSIFLSLLIVIGITTLSKETVLADNDATTGLKYTITDGKATISGFFAPAGFSGTLTIPSTLGGASVTSIGDYAFSFCRALTSITIPSNVTSIGNGAFGACSSLTGITIPSGVISIGLNAFSYCDKMTAITVDVANIAYKSIDGILLSKDGTALNLLSGRKDWKFNNSKRRNEHRGVCVC